MRFLLLSLILLFTGLARADYEYAPEKPELWTKIELSLRTKIRTGWLQRGILEELGETVLRHSQKVRQAALLYGAHDPRIDTLRAGQMALIHDLAEAIAPDFTPSAKVTAEEKHQIENEVWNKIVQEIPEATKLHDLWLELEARQTPTAQLVWNLDKLDAAIQALAYEKLGYASVADFFPYAQKKLTDAGLSKIFAILLEKRFPEVNTYEKYFTLLRLNGDRDAYEKLMEEKTRETLRLRNEARGL